MTTDLRHLLAIYVHAHRTGNSVPPHIDAEARTALADEPAVPKGREPVAVAGRPSDEDLWNTADLVFQANSWPTDAIRYARAVLARWGNPAPQPPANGTEEQVWPPSVADGCHEAAISAVTGSPEQQLLATAGNTIDNLWNELHRTVPVQATPAPAEREAAELVTWLQSIAETIKPNHLAEHQRYKRAADLLQRQVMVPVSVSERLPGPEDCDAEGGCWWLVMGCNAWSFGKYLASAVTHWLPAHALPLPEVGE